MIVGALFRLKSPFCIAKLPWQHAITSVLLVAVVAGIVGIPQAHHAAPRSGKNGRFPCEHCPCGCSSAEFCWDKCCCHSDQEKLRWASENEVTPPAFLVSRVAASARSLKWVSTTPIERRTACHCCRSPREKETLSSDQNASDASPKDLSKQQNKRRVSNASAGTRLVLLDSVAKCRGIDRIWVWLSSVMVDFEHSGMANPVFLLLFTSTIEDQWARSIDLPVDPPVP